METNKPIFTVSDINKYIKSLLSNDINLKNIIVKGEISNFKSGLNGHLYFSIKDENSIINVVMFNNYAKNLAFNPENGQEVIINASIDLYIARGSYQLLAYEMNPVGLGNYLIELEQLKQKLKKEGLFDESHKRPINLFPKAIGVITAKNSAAIKDILFNLKRRYPICDIYVFYSSVQGENAVKELLEAFTEAQNYNLDTIIIGRGGGASEDLSAFNDENLVRAIYNSKIPVISAVGHEIDLTLVDFVSDKRASTPTGAAELATIDIREIEQKFDYTINEMNSILINRVKNIENQINVLQANLKDSIDKKINDYAYKINLLKEKIERLNFKDTLKRGFSITYDENGNILKSCKNINKKTTIKSVLSDGFILSNVEEVRGN